MTISFRKYWFVFITQLKDAFAFRADAFVYFMWDVSTPIIMMSVWKTILKDGVTVGGFNLDQMLIYYLFIFIIRTALAVYPWNISEEIRSGYVNQHLVRPLDLLLYHLLEELAWRCIRVIFLIFSAIILTNTALRGIAVPWSSILSPWFLMAIIISFMLNYYLKAAIEMFAFWISKTESFRVALYVFEDIFAGALIPLTLLPGVFQSFSYFLPFNYFYSFPTKLIMGTATGAEITTGLFVGFCWLVGAFTVTRLLFNRGLKIYSANSG